MLGKNLQKTNLQLWLGCRKFLAHFKEMNV